ncbi:hypothetical protein C8R45DRAFT_923680 [Mycena sanguinolenta]|nr:hypothetical protein C8R45DRAFT_923680 [Mycena sanguinolenta]
MTWQCGPSSALLYMPDGTGRPLEMEPIPLSSRAIYSTPPSAPIRLTPLADEGYCCTKEGSCKGNEVISFIFCAANIAVCFVQYFTLRGILLTQAAVRWLCRCSTSDYSPSPVEVWTSFRREDPKAVANDKQQAGIC